MADIELILGADNGHSPADKLSQAYPKINRNFTELNEELADETATRIANDNAETAARIANDNAEIAARMAADEAHAESETAHPAESVTYSGEVSAAGNVKTAIDTLKTTLDQAVIGGDSGPEAATARYNTESGETYTTLQQRLDTEYAEADERISAAESEIVTARGTYGSVGARFGGVDAQLAETPSGVINVALKYGADPKGIIDSSAALQNAINEASSGTEMRTVYLPSGVYRFSAPLVSKGGVKIKGDGNNNGSTILKWVGAGTGPVIDFNDTDGGIIYRIVLEDITIDGGVGTKPRGIRLKNVSEQELSRVFIKSCSDAILFDSAAIIYMDRVDTASCDRAFNFETSSATPLFNNSFITLSRLNVWDTSDTIFKFKSGVVNNVEISDSWFENFVNFIKNENDGAQTTGFNHFNMVRCKVSNTSTSPYNNAKFIDIAAKSGNVSSQFINFSARECVIEVNSGDYICIFNTSGNTGGSSLIGHEFSFDNCLLFGAPTAVAWSNAATSRIRFTGSTVAQTSYYSGVSIPFFAGTVRLLDTPNLLGYTPAWTAATTPPALGNGTLVGRYIIRGGLCRIQLELTFGSSTSAGTGNYSFGLPIAHGSGYGRSIGTAYILDAGTMNYTGVAIIDAGASVMNVVLNNVASFVGASNPVTWASGDKITIAIEYPVAS